MIVAIFTLLVLTCSYLLCTDYLRKLKVVYYHGTCLGKIKLYDRLNPEVYVDMINTVIHKNVKQVPNDIILVFYHEYNIPHGVFLYTYDDKKLSVSMYADVNFKYVYKIRAITGESIVRELRKCHNDKFLLDCCIKTIDQCYGG